MILAETKGLPREEWLEIRRKGIGGSDAGAVCGLNPYRSAIDVWADKTGGIVTEKKDSEAMRVGRDLEDYVAQRFTEATGKKVRRKNAILQCEEYPFMIANIDRVVVGENALLECKTTSAYNADLWRDDNVPESYEIQCHHYMAVTGAEKVYVACLIMGIDFVIREIERDEGVVDALHWIEGDFWNRYVVTGEMPPPDGSKNAKENILRMYPSATGDEEVDLTELEDRLNRYDAICPLIDSLTREKEEIIQYIQIGMKDAERARIGARKVSWKNVKPRETIDGKKLKEEHPEIYQAYVKIGKPTRRFAIAKKKEENA